ncbi:MAG: hypothetical protein CMJ39_10495 [Phycisphaerae bacterium]|nr:hypothetical protein [Phycisphaerae bacterium]|tara:strand:- start:50 stop:1033 length:984 start_codon:yes stop_codon:yes gene_type:complete
MKQRCVLKLVLGTSLLAGGGTAIGSECCVADFTGDDQVSTNEVLGILEGWGACPDPCPMDLDQSGAVNATDLLIVLDRWGACPPPNDGSQDHDGDYMDLTDWGNFHGSNNNSHLHEMVDGRTRITTEAMVAYNNLRAFLDLPPLTFTQVGQWAFNNALTNNSQAWGNDLLGVGLYYAMQGAKVGWITDEKYDPQMVADIQRTARRVCDPIEMQIQVMDMVREYGIDGYADYLESNGMVETFINTLKMEPHYGGWMHGRCHGFRPMEGGIAINHDLNHLTVLSWDQMQPFMNDTFDWPQWDALDVSDSGVIEYFQSMVVLGDPEGENM